MKKLKVVQIGIGHDHAYVTYRTLLDRSDIYELCGVCPIDDEADRANNVADYNKALFVRIDEVLSMTDLDAVIIETDDWNLTKYAKMFADRGLHVHMDKPGGTSQEEYEELLRTFKKTGKVFHTGYMYRYNPEIKRLLNQAKNGEFGNVYTVEAHMDCEHPTEKRNWLGNFKGGMMYFLGCHLVDLILLIQGMPDEIVPLNFSTGYDGVESEDVGMAVFKYKNGMSFCKTSALEPGGFMRRQLVVCGTNKCIELRPIEEYTTSGNNRMITRRRECLSGLPWTEDGKLMVSEEFNRYSGMMEDFVRIVNGEKQSDFSLEYEARLHRVLLAACGVDIDYKAEIRIQIKDISTVYAEYANGATGVFITTTGEYLSTNRLEISGDKGKLVIEGNSMKFTKLASPEREWCFESGQIFTGPEKEEIDVDYSAFNTTKSQHKGITQNFTNAILQGEELIAPGKEGINGLRISNAIFLSSWLGKKVDVPVDGDLFYEMLQEKIKNSKYEKNTVEVVANFDGTYGDKK